METKNISTSLSLDTATDVYRRLDDHKEKVDTKFEKHVSETKTEINKIDEKVDKRVQLLEEALEFERRARSDSRERRTAEMNDLKKDFSEFKTTTAQSFNIVHEHLNIVDGRVTLLEVQMHEMIDHMSKKGTETARNIQLDKLVIDMDQDEYDFLLNIVKGQGNEWVAELDRVRSECLKNTMEATIDLGLSVYSQTREVKKLHDKLCPNDKRTLMQSFVDSFAAGIVNPLSNVQNPVVQTTMFALKVLVEGGKFGYVAYKHRESKKQMAEYWQEQCDKFEKDIINYLKYPVESYFQMMLDEYQIRYAYNYGRDDVSLSVFEVIRPFKHMSHYTRTFAKIPGYEQYIYAGTEVAGDLGGFEYVNYRMPFNRNEFLKNGLTETEKQDFDQKFKQYRAVKAQGGLIRDRTYHKPRNEFENQFICGDRSLSYNPIDSLFRSSINRGIKEFSWRKNARRLKDDILRKCVMGNQSKTLDELVTERNLLVIIKNYADINQSLGATQFYEKRLERAKRLIQSDKIELFEAAFDLYQKLTNSGIANKNNFLTYPYIMKLVEVEGFNSTQLILDTVHYGRDAWDNQPQPITHTRETITTTTEIDGILSIRFEVREIERDSMPNRFGLEAVC